MSFVLDASIAAAWALKDESAPLAEVCLDRLTEMVAIVPGLFWFEIRNVAVTSERRGRLTTAETATLLAMLERLPIRSDREPDSDAVLDLARRHRLTVYDAAYLELARRLAVPLATLDRRLVAAGQGEAVRPFSP